MLILASLVQKLPFYREVQVFGSIRRPRPRRAALLLVTCAVVGIGAAPAQAVTSTAACPDVEVTTVRGMGEPANSNGWVLGPIATALQSQLPQGVKLYPLPYAAGQDIIANTNQGIKLLTDHLDLMAKNCAKTKFVVLGFSLGAVVVGETFAPNTRYPGVVTTTLPSRIDSHVASVIMFGDTRFNSRGPEAAGTFWAGVDAPYARPASAFARFGNHVRNVCNAQDGICQDLPASETTAQAHQDYVKYQSAVVSYVSGQLTAMSG